MDGTKARVPRIRPGKFAAAVFLTTAATVVAVMMAPNLVADAQESSASAGGADSDGYVPVRSVCFGDTQYATTDQYAGEQQYTGEQQYATDQYAGAQYATSEYSSEQLGTYSWYNDGYATYGTIAIDDCALDAIGAGPEDRERVLAHERGHADGLLHSDDPNDLMYPVVLIEGS